MDRSVEVGVVADHARKQHVHIALREEVLRYGLAMGKTFRQQLTEPRSKPPRRIAAAGHKLIERVARARPFASGARGLTTGEIENLVADRRADPTFARADAEDTERQILERKVAMPVCGLDPASQSHPDSLRSAIGSSNEHDPNEIANCS